MWGQHTEEAVGSSLLVSGQRSEAWKLPAPDGTPQVAPDSSEPRGAAFSRELLPTVLSQPPSRYESPGVCAYNVLERMYILTHMTCTFNVHLVQEEPGTSVCANIPPWGALRVCQGPRWKSHDHSAVSSAPSTSSRVHGSQGQGETLQDGAEVGCVTWPPALLQPRSTRAIPGQSSSHLISHGNLGFQRGAGAGPRRHVQISTEPPDGT